MSYYWQDPFAAEWLSTADAIEIAGITDLGHGVMERSGGNSKPDFWSVYVHRTGRGVMDIADFDTLEAARAFANEQSVRFDLPIHDFA